MKGKIKQGLEKVVNFVKDNSKTLIAVGGITFGGWMMDYTAPKVNAAEIQANNVSWNVSKNDYDEIRMTKMITGDNYHEKFLTSEDEPYVNDFSTCLTIFTKEFDDSNKMDINAKKGNTPGWDVYLGTNQFVTGPMSNDLELQVNSAQDLENRKVIAYNVEDPNTIYEVPKILVSQGGGIIIPLNPIQNQPAGEYAHWRVETPALVPGDCASAEGPGKLDGKVDLYDIQTLGSEWLNETVDNENFDNADVNYDGIVNFQDFAVMANSYSSGE